MGDWWCDLDEAILGCLAENGAMAPADLCRRLGMSETAVTSLICLLAQAEEVRICLVERRATGGKRDVHAA
jgi:AsnC-type helix-turn-helix domain